MPSKALIKAKQKIETIKKDIFNSGQNRLLISPMHYLHHRKNFETQGYYNIQMNS
jgi:hypothetical protein